VVYFADLSGSMMTTLAYIHVSEMETNKVWKTQQYDELSGSVSRTLTYIHLSEMESNNLKKTGKWFTLLT